uniref:hypothetical protein n=1 Tax=Modestobacter marinus TaxID=477641 RepID=UPI00201AD7AE
PHDHGPHSHLPHDHAGHSHSHDPAPHQNGRSGGGEDDGKRVRAAKDRPGRHDDSYGARGGPADAPATPREVRSGQGSRSFSGTRGGSARRRPV